MHPTSPKPHHQNKGGAGARTAHDQLERNFSNDRDKSDVKGQSTPKPRERGNRD